MALFRFSQRAEADVLGIGAHTVRTWGEDQAVRYLIELEECCQMPANKPVLGRNCDHIRKGVRRMEISRHVIFYRQEFGGILVCRVLHKSMLPERHAIDDE